MVPSETLRHCTDNEWQQLRISKLRPESASGRKLQDSSNSCWYRAGPHQSKSTTDCQLIHWGRMTHICAGNLTAICSDNGLSPDRHQAIIWTNAGILLIVRRAGLLWSQQDFEWRWSVPLFKCLTVLEFSFILFDLCLLITFFNFIMNYVPIVTFWIFTYHKIWILSIMFCFIWRYWIINFLACLEVSWRVVS